ncbi:AfsR/SARP family transcriptional regulator [Streptomyces lunalinharesii]
MPPPRVREALQGHIAGLRKALEGSDWSVLRQGAGYVLRGSAAAVDTEEFRRLVAAADAEPEDEPAAALLRAALGLWQGDALTGVPEGELRSTLGAELDEARLWAVETLAEHELRSGRGAAVVRLLEETLASNRLREPLTGALMRALSQEGRQAEALEVYHETRQRLRDELGVAPGQRLLKTFEAVLRGHDDAPAAPQQRHRPSTSTAAPGPAAGARHSPQQSPGNRRPTPCVIPRQLPRLPGKLVGRSAELAWLDRECDAARDGYGMALVTGPAGVGKTALVVRWAHGVAERYPDGQLFADLRGFDPGGPTSSAAVLSGFLEALGVPAARIPEDIGHRQAYFRDITQPLRLLVVLDNAPSAESVRPLLPTGSGCATVVTGRSVLADLVILDGVAPLALATLSRDEALQLVEAMTGAHRVAAEPGAARRLLELCGRLPLALRIAGARLAARPNWSIADLAAELEDERQRLGMLRMAEDHGVAAALSATRRLLAPDADRLLTLLALHPGPQIDALAAAALLGCGAPRAHEALGTLGVYHLVEEASPGRFGWHDLVRLYCGELLDGEVGDDERGRATTRLLDYYLAATAEAGTFTRSSADVGFGPGGVPPEAVPRFACAAEALAWYREEESAVQSLIGHATKASEYEAAWKLADNCVNLYLAREAPGTWLECAQAGLGAAEHLADPYALTRLHYAVGSAQQARGRLPEAQHHLRAALRFARDLPLGLVRVRSGLAVALIHITLGEDAEGLACLESALAESRALGHIPAEALTLNNLAYALLKGARFDEARDAARQAVALLSAQPVCRAYLAALLTLCEALLRLGAVAEAEERLRESIHLCRVYDYLGYLVSATHWYADLLEGLGRDHEADVQRAVAEELSEGEPDSWTVERTSPAVALWSVPVAPVVPADTDAQDEREA